ncbi:hypothetical protein DCAR_0206120 [Daucus carota subsp. sativus]|uniref:ADP-ribosyl cyclase/cyclic ADP-ribose hydrolase n=1 Tax=Daucus carota subsp. sativus TaxID=79200 RepID=A0AAF0WCJ1_DAUCS|nr:hypothetical protein DCAR_0206120 [Daucus carota subsp. sativus]
MSAIIIFSQNYAYSTWCLDELVLILERKTNSRYLIIPIFYEVEIRDIKHQLGNYGLALEKHRARHNDKVDKWKEALAEVGNIFGQHHPYQLFDLFSCNLFIALPIPPLVIPDFCSVSLLGSNPFIINFHQTYGTTIYSLYHICV